MPVETIILIATTLGSTAGGGILGNRADYYFCKVVNQIKENIRRNSPPDNEHLSRAFHLACFNATRHILSRLNNNISSENLLSFTTKYKNAFLGEIPIGIFGQIEKDWLKKAHTYLENKIKEIDSNTSYLTKQTNDEYQQFTQPNGKTGIERAQEFRQKLTEDTIEEIKIAIGEHPPSKFIEAMNKFWFGLVCDEFQDALSRNQQLANLFQNGTLTEIATDTGIIRIQLNDFLDYIPDLIKQDGDKTRDKIDNLETKVDEVATKVLDGIKTRERELLDSELNNHTLSILNSIHSEVKFGEINIKIARNNVLDDLKKSLNNSTLTILSGEGGVGKTALVKDFYDSIKATAPFFIFKSTEFNTPHINSFFKNYGSTFTTFIQEYKAIQEKYVVVDSAEKLSDLEYPETFQEFLSTLILKGWKIIFTTRHSYLDDLKFQLIEHYRLNFQHFDIEKLEIRELEALSEEYNFLLPKDEKLLEFLRIPFYLSEYLENYKSLNIDTNFINFKKLLWNKQILKSSHRKNNIHLKREKCFLNIARRRADTGNFFVNVDECDETILQALEEDEIIGYDSLFDGYFITHDIYEEWALDELIEREFRNLDTYEKFFASLGSALPVRRAFRNWLSEKLLSSRDEIRQLIENSFVSSKIDSFWKDEIIVSVLLSDYSQVFFQMFEKILLQNNQEILTKIIFLLRIACKEIDDGLLNSLGIKNVNSLSLQTIFTKPKGKGWDSTIEFIYKNKELIGLSKIDVVVPLLAEWNNTNKRGDTTKYASQIGLFYYEEIYSNEWSYQFKDNKDQLVKLILDGASEIKDELNKIFDEVISKNQTDHREKYYELIKVVLGSLIESAVIANTLPEQVVKLADLFWFISPKERDSFDYDLGVEKFFCLSRTYDFRYFPASAFQTPVYQLLKASYQSTIDFILSFTNKTVECYAKSSLDENQVIEVDVFITESESVKQYLSARIWHMYRNLHVVPDVLESIHMALEKWLFDYERIASQSQLENICIYLLKNSKSASITAVVTSVVLAFPSKLFKVAEILFKTKEFFIFDKARMLGDSRLKGQLLGFKNSFPSTAENAIYEDERLKTCDEEHRKLSLEELAFSYQVVRQNEEFEAQRESIWGILDEYYKKLPPESEQNEDDKTWRFALARMDLRKMTPKVEEDEKSGQQIIKFIPELSSELAEISEKTLQDFSEKSKYWHLQIWAEARFSSDKKTYEQYQQYESNPRLALEEIKTIIERLTNENDVFSAFNRSIPSYVCSVLLRDFFGELDDEEREFCSDMIMEFASLPLVENYEYQSLDGTQPSITSLYLIIRHFSERKLDAKFLLIMLLLYPRNEINIFAVNSLMSGLWQTNFDDAQSIFIGYLYLQPKFTSVKLKLEEDKRNNNPQKLFVLGWNEPHPNIVTNEEHLAHFLKTYEQEIKSVVEGNIDFEQLDDIEDLRLDILTRAFELLPLKINDEVHDEFVTRLSVLFANTKKVEAENKESGFTLRRRIYRKFAYYVLSSTEEKAKKYVQPFINNFEISEEIAEFLESFIWAEEELNEYENFWKIWNLFYDKVVAICEKAPSYHYTKPIVRNYLLAWRWWKKEAKSWHSLKDREKIFFKKIATDIGKYPIVLDSLTQFLNEIGSDFLDDGIFWISDILQNNRSLITEDLEKNTTYYLENIVRRFILVNRHKIKTTRQLKERIIVILDFLIEHGSMRAYLLRESIL